MLRPTHLIVSLLLTLCALSLAPGQDVKTVTNPGIIPIVTVSASAERLRLTAPGTVVQMQLQIYNDAGQLLFDVTSKGNVLDWTLQDSGGERLVPGSYLCVVTVKSLSGKLSQRIGQALIQEKQVELQRVDATQLTAPQQQAVGPIEENAALTVLKAGEGQATTVLANNGQEGQIIRDRGALSFRIGDFFSGNDQEQMRLTEAGNLGIGTANPQFKLDVAGAVRARQGFVFNDGSTLSVNEKGALILTGSDGTVAPNAAGTGTQNHLAKWIETGGAGTLGDSSVTELANGFVGIGTVSPTVRLDVVDDTSGVGGFQLTNHTNGSLAQLQNRLANNAGAFAYYGITSGGYTQAPILSNRAFFGSYQVDTVIWTQTANDILFATNGLSAATERMRIKSSGNVGIGNPAPGAKLDVTGNINTSTQYNIGGNHALSAPGLNNIFAGFGAGASNTSGEENTLLGVSAGSSNVGGRNNSFVGLAAGVSNIAGNSNTAIGYFANFGSGSLTNATAIGANAQVNQSNSLVLGSINGFNSASANTNVGIGITAPSATLHVVSYTNSIGENTATFQAPNIGSNQSHIHYGTTGDWYIRSASGVGKVVMQDTGGNVGIGTTSPVFKLDVRDGTGASGSGGHLQIGAPNSDADEKIIAFGDSQCFGVPCVYIGEKDADDRMVLSANAGFRFKAGNVLPDLDNNQTLGSSTNRWSAVWAANGTIQTSDVRLKQGVADLKYGLSQVMQLRPVSFQWKSGSDNRTHLGLIAQEVDAVMPEAVEKSADANAPLGMNYSNLIPVLIKAIQEQQGTLERAQAEVKTLRAENEALSRRIISIEATSTTTVATSTKKAQ